MRLALGTAQFGLHYGVSNSAGQTPAAAVQQILGLAWHAGVDLLDTAAAYGESETVLGQAGVARWRVVSKIPALPADEPDAAGWVVRHAEQSLQRLGIARLYGLLLHRADDALGERGAAVVAGLREAQRRGFTEKVGYSLYAPDPLARLCDALQPELVQAPLNVLDQRLIESGWLARLAAAGVEVHTRSAFLQGLLLMQDDARPPQFSRWRETWARWRDAVQRHGGSALAACLGFIKSQEGVARVVVGIETSAQLSEMVSAWDAALPLDGRGLSCADPLLIDPANWSRP